MSYRPDPLMAAVVITCIASLSLLLPRAANSEFPAEGNLPASITDHGNTSGLRDFSSRIVVRRDGHGIKPEQEFATSALLERADQQGPIRVIVGLKNFSETPELSPGRGIVDREERQKRVKRLQDRLLQDLDLHLTGDAGWHLTRMKNIPYLVLALDQSGIEELLTHPLVSTVNTESGGQPLLNESLELTNIAAMHDPQQGDQTGSGYSIAVLDSGVDTSHEMFSGKAIYEACYSTPVNGESLCAGSHNHGSTGTGSGQPCVDPSGGPRCSKFHGTLVAGVAVGNNVQPQQTDAPNEFSGTAKDADLITINVFSIGDQTEHCTPGSPPCVTVREGDVISALDRVYDLQGATLTAAVNISFVLSFDPDLWSGGQCDADWPGIVEAVDLLESVGVAVVAAVGNHAVCFWCSPYVGKIAPPSCLSKVVSVSGVKRATWPPTHVNYANAGEALDLLAPAGDGNLGDDCNYEVSGIWSAAYGTQEVFSITDPQDQECEYVSIAGTSLAAPHVSGSYALMKGMFGSVATPSAVLDQLSETGVSVSIQQGTFNSSRPFIDLDAAQTGPTAPAAPSSLTVSSWNCFGLHGLSWGAASGTVTEYQLHASTSPTYSGLFWAYIGDATFQVVDVAEKTWYRVRACNRISCSSWVNGNQPAEPVGHCP